MFIFKGNSSVSIKQKNQIYTTLCNFSCSRSSERVSGPNCSEFIPCTLILLLRNPLWVCGREAPLSPARPGALGRAQNPATSIVPLLVPSCSRQTPLTAASAAQPWMPADNSCYHRAFYLPGKVENCIWPRCVRRRQARSALPGSSEGLD